MKKMLNFLSIVSLLFLSEIGFSEPAVTTKFPKQILNISSDERVKTNTLLADKDERKLSVLDYEGISIGRIKDSYNIDIGKKSGDKKRKDDKRTPEGIYVLMEKKTQPEIPFDLYGSMAFTTNYPNFFDKYENKTGSGIWLHSVPDSVPLTRGSRGCVVLRNDDIKKIESSIIPNKTILIIDKKIDWVDHKTHKQEKEHALNWLEQWRNDWESQNMAKYLEHYDEEFSAPPFKFSTWKKHKMNLKERYKFVNIQLSEPNIFQVKNQYIFQFVQNYKSDAHEDTGVKTLYVIKKGNSLRITREEWSML
jgi:murein L,D-transpeptidase YafK